MTPTLNRRLKLERSVRTRDDAGGYTEAWAVVGDLWAAVKPGTGREGQATGLTLAKVPYKITVRAAPHGAPSRPVAGQRFRDGDRIMHILAVSDSDPKARYLTCFALEAEVAA